MTNVLGSLFQSIADAIRAKSGSADTMTPSQFPEQIAGIKAGGSVLEVLSVTDNGTYTPEAGIDGFSQVTVNVPQGSSGDVHYITFMDGETVLYTKPVAHGDDCADIISRGLIDAPSREETETCVYTFLGWGASDDGEVDETLLENVTENRTVYAIYHVLTTLATGSKDAVYWKLTDDGVLRVWGEGAAPTGSILGWSAWRNSEGTDMAALVTTAIFEEGVTTVGEWSFLRCHNLASVTLPETITEIGYSAFYECKALKSITLPESLVRIDRQAFIYCTGLSTLTIPANVNYIGQSTLNDSGVYAVYFKNTSGWWYANSATATSGTNVSSSIVAQSSTICTYIKTTYRAMYWFRG